MRREQPASLSGAELVSVLVRLGFEQRPGKGSHFVLTLPGPPRTFTTVPLHRELDRGTLGAFLRQTGVSREELLAAIR
jgi:predicted RNA binding protein YcfA (HicA-like mRNA interferase family)